MEIIFFAFPFPELESVQTIKLVSSLHLPFYFLFYHFFLEHLNNTFETTLSYALVVEWNYYVNYQTTQTWSRSNAVYKMELFRTIFDSFHSLTNFTKISNLDAASIFYPTLITDIFTSQDWIRAGSEFEANFVFI